MTDYVEMHCHSYYSLLDGAASPEDLLMQTYELGMHALALTDHDAVYGAIPFMKQAESLGIYPIFGAELTIENGHHLTMLVEDQAGWSNLCWLITQARHNAPKGEARLPLDCLYNHTAGLIALSGCRLGEISSLVRQGEHAKALERVRFYRDLFPDDRFYIELQHHFHPDDKGLLRQMARLSQTAKIPYVATNNVHYVSRRDARLHDLLVSVRHLTPLDECQQLRPNSEYYLKPAWQMKTRFKEYPIAIANTLEIAARCQFKPQYGLQTLPQFPCPAGYDAEGYLRHLCEQSMHARGLHDTERIQAQVAHELTIISRSGLANYFLIVWDIVRYSREQNILCQGRGSAANSMVAYLLGISPINPLEHDLVFERFLSDERQLTPDIDIDFQADRREEVIQYLYNRYGHDHAAMACTFITFRSRSAIRDAGKALGLPIDLIERLQLDSELSDGLGGKLQQQVLDLSEAIHGTPRHLGIHNGGMVITGSPITDRIPTEPATMQDRYVVQWDKDALEDAGLVKIDILGLRMLSLIAEARDLVAHSTGKAPDFDALNYDDPAVYEMISSGDTIGVFQVESRAQAQVLPRLRPRHFNDLIVSISLIRPGPVQGDMVHPYLRRRFGQEAVTYFHPTLEPALKETLGVILFQEQVLKVARDLAGFTAGQGELLRRALGSGRPENIKTFHAEFVEGATHRGVKTETAELVFEKLSAFGGYSFPKSHAAAFAVLVYRSAWLKRYYPIPFYVALLNNQPMGFWSPAVIVNDMQRRGLTVHAVDVNRSAAVCTMEGDGIRLGLNYVKGFQEATAQRVIDARGDEPFAGLEDFCKRTQLPRRLIENLILVGAFDTFGGERRQLLWTLGTLSTNTNELDLLFTHEEVPLTPLSPSETLGYEYSLTGVSVEAHPIAHYRESLRQRGVLGSADLLACAEGIRVRVAGLVVMHQAPQTAKGFRFLTLEDEDGFINIVIRPDVYPRFKRVIREHPLLIVEGIIERQGVVVNVVARVVMPVERG